MLEGGSLKVIRNAGQDITFKPLSDIGGFQKRKNSFMWRSQGKNFQSSGVAVMTVFFSFRFLKKTKHDELYPEVSDEHTNVRETPTTAPFCVIGCF